jgi:hypothetical protein
MSWFGASILFGLIGAVLGRDRGCPVAGLVLGATLGLIGLIILWDLTGDEDGPSGDL